MNSDLQKVWAEALDTKVQNRVKRDSLFPRNFYPNARHNGTRDRNFWRVNDLPDDEYLRYPYSTVVRVETIDSRGNVVTCTGTVVGVSTVLTAPECVYGTLLPPLILTGYKDNTFYHAFLTDELWIPSNYNPCTFYSDGWAQFPQTGSDYYVPVPSKGSFALLHIARNALKKEGFYVEIGDLTGTLGLGAVYLPDLATFIGYDGARDGGESLNVLEANVELVFNENTTTFTQLAPGTEFDIGFYNDWFNVEGDWEARGAPAIVNIGAAYPEDLQVDPAFWYKRRGVVSGVVSRFYHEIPDYVPLEVNLPSFPERGLQTSQCAYGPVVSSSGSMFGVDFVAFLYEYCYAVCESACDIDHACGNGRLDEPQKEFGQTPFADNLDYYPPWYLPEQCDMGFLLNNELPNSLCRSDCRLARCGDGITDNCPPDGRAPEQCDGGFGCTADCRLIAPEANDDFYVTAENTAITFNVTLNDNNIDPATTQNVINIHGHGTVINLGNGNFTYTPNNGFSGATDTFLYIVCDSTAPSAKCVNATVHILVKITAPPLTAYCADKGTVKVPLLASGDSPNCITIATPPTFGSATVDSQGRAVYTANQVTFHSLDTFLYQVCSNTSTVCDPNDCATAVVTMHIAQALPDFYSMPQGQPSLTLTPIPPANDTNIIPSSISQITVPAPSGATIGFALAAQGDLQYFPPASFAGTDTFIYQVKKYFLRKTWVFLTQIMFRSVPQAALWA